MTDDNVDRREASRPPARRIALVAHDHKKQDLREWAGHNRELLSRHLLVATGTTGRLLADELGLQVTCVQSGPLGGDQQIGALIASGDVDLLVFFTDPMHPQPHDPDVKALIRIAVVWDIPIACNRASADLLITSPLLADYPPRREGTGRGTGARAMVRSALKI